jgi:hypothetical protein
MWEDSIKVDLREVGCEGVDWIQVESGIGTGGRGLCTRLWTFEFHENGGISWLAERKVSFSMPFLCKGLRKLFAVLTV